jgi:hypothetical protein
MAMLVVVLPGWESADRAMSALNASAKAAKLRIFTILFFTV